MPTVDLDSSASHHFLELLKVDASVAIGVDRFDHPPAVTEGALLPESLQHRVKLTRGDLPVLVEVVEIEGVFELLVSTGTVALVSGPGAAVKLGELVQINVAIAVLVDLGHYALHLIGRGLGTERTEHVLELVAGDFAITVLVELAEYLPNLIHRSQRARLVRNHRRFFCHEEDENQVLIADF